MVNIITRSMSANCLQSTHKVGCPAHLVIKEFEIFPEFCADVDGLTPTVTYQVKEDKLRLLWQHIGISNRIILYSYHWQKL